jgi:hypothetical protein
MWEMKIEIDPEMADKIIQADLVDSYVRIKYDAKNRNNHPDDLKMYKKVLKAIEVLGDWYFIPGEFKQKVKEAKKNEII